MPEVDNARETIRFIRLLLDLGVTNEWFLRMMIGRMYYAAHHLGRRLLLQEGLQPGQWRASVHQRVLDELWARYVATGRLSKNGWNILNWLRDIRRTADYELSDPIRLRDVRRAARSLEALASECYRLLGVS